jgi:hypothetical protein
MDAVLFTIGGLYLIMVGVHGNAMPFFSAVAGEQEFLYWVVAIFVITALWESPYGAQIARPLAALVVMGFLLSQNSSAGQRNYALIGSGLKQVLPAL